VQPLEDHTVGMTFINRHVILELVMTNSRQRYSLQPLELMCEGLLVYPDVQPDSGIAFCVEDVQSFSSGSFQSRGNADTGNIASSPARSMPEFSYLVKPSA